MIVEGLVNLVQMSIFIFYCKFKDMLGVLFVEYINVEKIKFVKKFMKEDCNMFVFEVVYKFGFNNVSYFNW